MVSVEHSSPEAKIQKHADLVGTFHRVAGIGPGYQVLKILDERYAWICLYETDEEARYPIEDVRLDPHPDAPLPNGDRANDIMSQVSSEQAQGLIGQWRRIGKYGPRYEVVSIASRSDAMIRVHTTDEVTDYPISEILKDPVD